MEILKRIEEVFFNEPLILLEDWEHSKKEKRVIALGHTNLNKLLFISFTNRDGEIRVISARPMSNKERRRYEKA